MKLQNSKLVIYFDPTGTPSSCHFCDESFAPGHIDKLIAEGARNGVTVRAIPATHALAATDLHDALLAVLRNIDVSNINTSKRSVEQWDKVARHGHAAIGLANATN